ncbi:MAG: hypothetical protein U0872_16635 [Planctomycetaceae bacterium]
MQSGPRLFVIFAVWLGWSALQADDLKFHLEEPADDVRVFGVGLRVTVNGKLQVGVGDAKVTPLPLNVSAALSYRERRLVGVGQDAEGLRAAREYAVTEADIEVKDEKTHLKLPEPLKLMVAQGRIEGIELFSLTGPLTNNELDLLRSPCDTLALPQLLPGKAVAIGESWKPAAWVAQLLAGIEAATKSELSCELESVKQKIAVVRFAGSVEGATVGAPTKVSLKGTVDYDLDTKSITAADITQTEQRSIGAVSPGLDVTANVRLLRKPAVDPGRLGDKKTIDLATSEPEAAAKFLRFDSPWNLSLLHSRSWHMFHQTDKVVIFRLLDQGALIAQCNLAAIPNVAAGSHTSEEEFLTDIRGALGENLKAITTTRVLPAKDGRYVLQVIATGAVKERAMTWIYYLVADPSGRQASLQFSLDSSLLDALADRDRELIESLRFVPNPAAQSPTPRKQ